MRRVRCVAVSVVVSLSSALVAAQATGVETIVMLRHAEKPEAELGQINCRGLNRALALPAVLRERFDPPAAIFAPNPGVEKEDGGQRYNYLRPLATIEPTAIGLGLPVNTRLGLDDIAGLQKALLAPEYRNATVFVAWEHKLLVKAARALMQNFGGSSNAVPKWPGTDFDSLYVISIVADATGRRTASFVQQHQGLNEQSDLCPGSVRK